MRGVAIVYVGVAFKKCGRIDGLNRARRRTDLADNDASIVIYA
jgi:hypothetical protein